jgi:deoxycytidine triphosphate deaminase
MILGKDKLIEADDKIDVRISLRKNFSAFSLDIRIDKLYRMKPGLTHEQTENLSQEEYIKEALEEICVDEGYVVRYPEFYLWQPLEEIFLSKGYSGRIATRSSWARIGCAVRSESDIYLRDISKERFIKPLCILSTFGTDMQIKKNDAFAQLFIEDNNTGYVNRVEELHLINSGHFIIKSKDRTLLPEQIRRPIEEEYGNIVLTMDSKIKLYNGKTIIPSVNTEECFDTIKLQPGRPLFLKKDSFFLSSSEEYVEIPCGYVGHVAEAAMHTNPRAFSTKPAGVPLPFRTHPNAPYIGPSNIFKGKITFENLMKFDSYIYPGMKQSELYIERLNTQDHNLMQSRYMNQQQVTGSKL